MKKSKLFLALFLLATGPLAAQWKGFSFGPFFEAAWTKGDFAAVNRNGVGAGLAADIRLKDKLVATGSAAYLYFGAQSGSEAQRLKAVPIRVGLKYRLPLVYLKFESGQVNFTNDGSKALILSPGVGFRLLGLDVQGSYESWLGNEGRSFASLKIGYHF